MEMGCREPLCTTKPLSETAKSETAKEPPAHQSQRFSLETNTDAQKPGLTGPRFKDAPLPVGCYAMIRGECVILSQALLEIAKSSVSRRRERRCAFGTQRPDPNNHPLVIWLVFV